MLCVYHSNVYLRHGRGGPETDRARGRTSGRARPCEPRGARSGPWLGEGPHIAQTSRIQATLGVSDSVFDGFPSTYGVTPLCSSTPEDMQRRHSPCRNRQANLVAERGVARIALVTQDERVVEDERDARIAAAPGPVEPVESRVGVVTQRVGLGDLIGSETGILPDQSLERRIGCVPITPDLPCQGERDILPRSGSLLLCGGKRRPRVTALDLDDRQRLVKARGRGLQLDGLIDRPQRLIETVERREIRAEPAVILGPQRLARQ